MDFRKMTELVNTVADRYFIDPATEEVGGEAVEHWKILMGMFSYLGRRNSMLVGRPGTGKTTYSGVISSVISGLPFDLYDFLKIQGHPDQTKDTMLARADLGRLAEEGVVWQASVYLPALTVDEINRLSPGKQAILLEYIRTGGIEHLGKYFTRGKIPFFATMNYDGAGTYPVPAPSLDRFDMSLEFNPGAGYMQDLIMDASRRIDSELKDPEETEKIVGELLRKDELPKHKLESLETSAKESRKKRNMPDISGLDPRKLDIPYSPDARTMLLCVWEEMNTTHLYGDNRRDDPRDLSNHNQPFASSRIMEGMSPRAWDSIRYYSTALAAFQGSRHIEIHHILAVAHHCLAHRLEFTEDYKAQYKEHPRLKGEREDMDLTRRLVSGIKDNYDSVSKPLKTLDAFLSGNLKGERTAEVEQIVNAPEPDHPLMRIYYNEAKKALRG